MKNPIAGISLASLIIICFIENSLSQDFTAVTNPQIKISGEVLTYPPALQRNAITNFALLMWKLNNSKTEPERYINLSEVARLAFAFGEIENARKCAIELLALDDKFQKEPWRTGDAAFSGNFVLGRIAVKEGRIEEAKQYLLKAGDTTGSPVLDSFGPNMSLANDLLKKGERGTVTNYFELCHKFWSPSDNGSLNLWTEEVNAGKIPDFGGNLYF
jgi:hypothetical protein